MLNFSSLSKKEKAGSFAAKKENGLGKTVLIGALTGLAVTIGFIAMFAAIMLIANADRVYASLFATLSVAAGAFFSSLYVAKRVSIKGILSGLIAGLCYFLVITAVSLAADGSGLTLNSLFHFVIIILSSAIGGIVGANRKRAGK